MGVPVVVANLALACLGQLLVPAILAEPVISLACLEGWTNIGLHCYRPFPHHMAWDMATDVCLRYGAQLLRIKDLDGKEAALGALSAEHGVSHLWLAYASSAHSWLQEPEQQLTSSPYPQHLPHPITPTTSARPGISGQLPPGITPTVGQVEDEMAMMTMNSTSPLPMESGKCVMARFFRKEEDEEDDNEKEKAEEVEGGRGGGAGEGMGVVWGFAPCLRLTAFLCQRPASPEGTFQCSNGVFVERKFVCDGDDDCGDLSDELDCEEQCRHHLQATSGLIMTPEWTDSIQPPGPCVWLLEGPVGYNAHLEVQFADLTTTDAGDGGDMVVVMGGLTVSTSRKVAPARGEGVVMIRNYVSVNNLMMVIVTVTPETQFTASFTAVKAEGFEPEQKLTATSEAQELKSPFYPGYLSGQDYVWVITALSPSHTLTIQMMLVELTGVDTVEIRDGNSVYAPLLHLMTSSRHEAGDHVTDHDHVQSTGRHVFIAMRTRGSETGKGFHFRYWQGCSIRLEDTSGSVVSPGYLIKGANYPANQTCVYDVTVPAMRTATLVFDAMDIHSSDQLRIESDGQWIHTATGNDLPDPIDLSSGSFRLTFLSDQKLTSRGFALRYSVGCPSLPTNSLTTVHSRSSVHHFGSRVTLTCSHGNAFPPLEPRSESEAAPATSLVLECLFGGIWNVTGSPVCRALCKPGWFYEQMTMSCELCPKHHYQSDVNATSCRLCPEGTVTENEGANSSSQCKAECPAGQRFCHELGACEDCPNGTFQSQPGQFLCLPCPLFKTTPRTGANSSSLCLVDVMDKETEQELDNQEFIVVSFNSGNNADDHHHHRRLHHRRPNPRSGSSLRLPSSISTFLLPSGNSKSSVARMSLPELAPLGKEATTFEGHRMRISGMGRLGQHRLRSAADAQTPIEAEEDSVDDFRRRKLSDMAKSDRESRWLKFLELAVNSESEGESQLKRFSVTAKDFDDDDDEMLPGGGGVENSVGVVEMGPGRGEEVEERGRERVKRAVANSDPDDDEGSCSGSGSGDNPCEVLNGQLCNDTQECMQMSCSTYDCVCKPMYQENESGGCVELPDNQKMYLTTPFALTYDPDLSDRSSMEFLTFKMECQEAFTDIFHGVEGWKHTQILYFRSGKGDEQTIVGYSLLLTVPALEAIQVKVAQAVLRMEQSGTLMVGSRSLTLAGHTGIFLSQANPEALTDSVDWCVLPSLHQCSGEKQCVDRGLRYTCQCPDSTTEMAGSCVHAGAIAGGVIGAVVAVAIIIIIIVIVRRRRSKKSTYAEDGMTEDPMLAYVIPPSRSRESGRATTDQPDGIEMVEPNVYSRISGPPTSHTNEPFRPEPIAAAGGLELPRHNTGESALVSDINVYSDLSGPGPSHTYSAFNFDENKAPMTRDDSQRIAHYANMAAVAPSPSGATSLVDSTRGNNRSSHVYMNIGSGVAQSTEQHGGRDHVYSNVGLQH